MSLKKMAINVIKKYLALKREKEIIPIPHLISSDKLLEGKIAMITGGTSGIGYAIAENFIRNGAKVIICGSSKDKLENAKRKLNIISESVKGIQLDISDVNILQEKITNASSLFEENRIDILVNSAGVNNIHTFFEVTEEDYDSIMNVNSKGTFFMCQAMGKYMIDHNIKGSILNISSASALRPASTPYILSKWAIKGLTLGLADVLFPHGITVNAIAPGPVATPMLNKSDINNIYNSATVSGRYSVPVEIANLATYMVSDFGKSIVGDTCYITGGSALLDLHR